MEHLLVDISDPAIGLQVKSFIKIQKGVNFKSVFEGDNLSEDKRHQQIMATSYVLIRWLSVVEAGFRLRSTFYFFV
jgi:hypothetical protein